MRILGYVSLYCSLYYYFTAYIPVFGIQARGTLLCLVRDSFPLPPLPQRCEAPLPRLQAMQGWGWLQGMHVWGKGKGFRVWECQRLLPLPPPPPAGNARGAAKP
jgi:hypothetical protein